MDSLKDILYFIEEYRSIDISNVKWGSRETLTLAYLKEYIEWNELTEQEKHKKRKFVFSVIQKTGNAKEFIVETTVIELYELAKKILTLIKKLPKSDFSIRLTAMLTVFMFHVNEQRDTRKMSNTSFKLIINILNSYLENKIFIEMNEDFSKMENLFNELDNLITP